jgi:RNA polymerase sigma factor (sigma-70 family)
VGDSDDGRASATARDHPADFEQFFNEQYGNLVKAVLYLVPRAGFHDAEDAAVHAMTEVYRRWDSPSGVSHPRRYAVVTAYHALLNSQKLRRHEREREQQWAADRSRPEPPAPDLVVDQEFVRAVLARLTPAEREVMWLVLEGFPKTEIGRILGKKANNVRQSALAARRRLRRLLEVPANDEEVDQ